jgi:hypothetical protein
MVIRPFQETILDALDEILAYNKVSLNLYFKTLQPLEFLDLNPVLNQAAVEEQSGVKLSSHIDEIDLSQYGEELDPKEWELIDSRKVDYDSEEELDAELERLNNPKKSMLSKFYDFVTTGVARSNATSSQDGVLFVSRYRYNGDTTDKSRPFCKKMTSANKLYRKEDIITMGEKPTTNPGWGPKGVDEYSIWLYKGGGACHHFWTRETYRRIGSFNKAGDNKTEVTPSQARKEGEIVPTVDSPLVYQKPIDMPYQGFLPTNPRFNKD